MKRFFAKRLAILTLSEDDIAVLDMIKNLDLRLIENVLMEEELHYLSEYFTGGSNKITRI